MNSPKCGHSFASLWPHCYHQRCTIPAVLIRSSLKRSTHSPVNHNYPHQHTLATFPIVMMSRCSLTQYLNHLDMTDELSSKHLQVHLIQRTNTHMTHGQLLLRLAAVAGMYLHHTPDCGIAVETYPRSPSNIQTRSVRPF